MNVYEDINTYCASSGTTNAPGSFVCPGGSASDLDNGYHRPLGGKSTTPQSFDCASSDQSISIEKLVLPSTRTKAVPQATAVPY
jgi:hypothetical protein